MGQMNLLNPFQKLRQTVLKYFSCIVCTVKVQTQMDVREF